MCFFNLTTYVLSSKIILLNSPADSGSALEIKMFYLGFSVYVCNTTDILQGTLCYKDDNFTTDTLPDVFNTTCPVRGQYVIYYNDRLPGAAYPSYYSNGSVNSNLCEVEVYGDYSLFFN